MKIFIHQTNHEKGFSTIIMVIILTIIGSILLTSTNLLMISWHKTLARENQYYHRFNKANSALNWALTQNWQRPTDNWQCLFETKYQWKVCIKNSLLQIDNYVLIRGESEGLFVYGLAHHQGSKLIVQKGHWLDYCPEKRRAYCE